MVLEVDHPSSGPAFFDPAYVHLLGTRKYVTLLRDDSKYRSLTVDRSKASSDSLLCSSVTNVDRWLISKERYEEALDMLAYYHANGNQNDATVQFEYLEMKDTIRMEVDASRNSNYIDFFRTRGNRWRLAILISLGLISQYSGNALFSNYMNLVYEGAGITSQNQKMAVSAENY